ncbi:hypothetical protein B296_00015901, partial [Ensete ventricosum]
YRRVQNMPHPNSLLQQYEHKSRLRIATNNTDLGTQLLHPLAPESVSATPLGCAPNRGGTVVLLPINLELKNAFHLNKNDSPTHG